MSVRRRFHCYVAHEWFGTQQPKRELARKMLLADVEGHGPPRPADLLSVGSDQKFVELLQEGAFALCTDEALGNLTTGEDEQCWDAHDAVLHCKIGVVVDVQFRDCQLFSVLIGDLFEDRCDLFTRSAPFGPEVDYDWLV